MTAVHWVLPDRPATLKYLTHAARTAEHLGFDGVVLPEGEGDPLVIAALLATTTERLRFTVPADVAPEAVATFRHYAGERLVLATAIESASPPEIIGRAVRLHVISRDTSGEAWARARRLFAEPTASKLEVYPNLLARGDVLTLVGGHAEVARRIEDYRDHGVEEFLLSGTPHLEEAYSFAEGVLPKLRKEKPRGHAVRAPSAEQSLAS
ncbi:luciferase-like monooxygenase [Herbihabitans rhizosphaerae]|uniref:Luciferase-like monooxygenase n=1 Tax=Herbihabitans rhizosphaerae TaxID=1872711 RepID=A0A4V2ERK0_9PSEU|nr:LLM class flavin-dependent oxidoreductase [Herbihabitans rhizosphaerae]RZS32219.1 luciferase-like monooxygenase [Herbihabitans rhizosphaerae]